MAKNWTMREAVVALKKGNAEDVMDIGRRFPLLHHLMVGALSGNTDMVEELLKALPEHITCNKVNGQLKGLAESDEVETEAEEDEAPVVEVKKQKKTKKVEVEEDEVEESGVDYQSMNGKQLTELLRKHNLQKTMKEEFGNKWNKENMVACLEKYAGESEVEEADEVEESEDEGAYDDMTAVELFKECKKRGLKVAPKKSADFYIEKLEADDKAKAKVEDDDDWGEDEEVVEEKPAKTKSKGKAKAKPAPVEDDDDDDDWDI